MIWLVLFVAWPLVVTGAFLVFRRRRVARRGRFAVASLVVGYLVMAMIGSATEVALPLIMAAVEPRAYLVVLAIVALAVATPFVISLAAMYAVSRRFIARTEFD